MVSALGDGVSSVGIVDLKDAVGNDASKKVIVSGLSGISFMY